MNHHRIILEDLAQYIRHYSEFITSVNSEHDDCRLLVSWWTRDPGKFHSHEYDEEKQDGRKIKIVGPRLIILHHFFVHVDGRFHLADPEYRKKILLFLCRIAKKRPYSNIRP